VSQKNSDSKNLALRRKALKYLLNTAKYPPGTVGHNVTQESRTNILTVAESIGLDPAAWKTWSKLNEDLDRLLAALESADVEVAEEL